MDFLKVFFAFSFQVVIWLSNPLKNLIVKLFFTKSSKKLIIVDALRSNATEDVNVQSKPFVKVHAKYSWDVWISQKAKIVHLRKSLTFLYSLEVVLLGKKITLFIVSLQLCTLWWMKNNQFDRRKDVHIFCQTTQISVFIVCLISILFLALRIEFFAQIKSSIIRLSWVLNSENGFKKIILLI